MSSDTVEEICDSPSSDRMAQLEINISNTNASSQVVLNDLRLLELLCVYPFLLNRPFEDADYDDWGWEQLTNAYNESYEGIQLSSPFTVAELQWRWDILRPLINSLARAMGQIPEPMWKVVLKINNRMCCEKTKKKGNSKCQDLVLSQLPFVEQLSHSQRLRLEVEFLDLILQEERRTKTRDRTNSKHLKTVQTEYDQFLGTIKVKELPSNTLQRLAMEGSPKIINANETNLVISNVFSSAEAATIVTNEPQIKTEKVEAAAPAFKPPTPVKAVSDFVKKEPTTHNPILRVPLKDAKKYVKKCRILLRRIDLDDYMPLATIRRSSRFAGK